MKTSKQGAKVESLQQALGKSGPGGDYIRFEMQMDGKKERSSSQQAMSNRTKKSRQVYLSTRASMNQVTMGQGANTTGYNTIANSEDDGDKEIETTPRQITGPKTKGRHLYDSHVEHINNMEDQIRDHLHM